MFTPQNNFPRDSARRLAILSSFVLLVSSFLPSFAAISQLEFPGTNSVNRVCGELVSADFIHRQGQFRVMKTGELLDFTLPPFGAILYVNAEADLRDVPLGTVFEFHLLRDADGRNDETRRTKDERRARRRAESRGKLF